MSTNESKKIIANNIYRLVQEREVKVADYAEAIEASPYTFYGWLAGRNYPHIELLYRTARFFGVTVDSLLEGAFEDGSEE